MTPVREAIERTIVLSLGAASLTRERVEGIVSDFVQKGQLGADEGRAMVDRIMARVRGEGTPSSAVVDRLEGGVQALLKEMGVARRADVSEMELRLDALEHRLRLLEQAGKEAPAAEPPSGSES
jgi:polyhydroxyalkanoate synthesis regulator phasin